jgi:hypothetical protein
VAENAHRGEVELEIGGKLRKLRFTLNSLAVVTQLFGLERMSQLFAITREPSPYHLRHLLHAALLPSEPELTPEEVGEWDVDFEAAQIRLAVAFIRAYRGGRSGPEEEALLDPTKATPSGAIPTPT